MGLKFTLEVKRMFNYGPNQLAVSRNYIFIFFVFVV